MVDPTTPAKPTPLTAADLLKSAHPLHQTFIEWCDGRKTTPSRRQATKFLQAFPAYRTFKTA